MKALAEELRVLIEREVWVDDQGYAHDDEGNRWYVGMASGTYSYREVPPPRDDRPGRRPYRPKYNRARTPKKVKMSKEAEAQAKVLEDAIAKRKNKFLSSILSQVQAGRTLSDKQNLAVRRILHKLRMHDESKLFK